jgi:adenylate cyclase
MYKILIIDDDEISSLLLRKILINLKYEVVLANSGIEGINLVNTELPDIVLCDLYLGDVDGFLVGVSVKADPVTREIPLIMMSADYSESVVVNALENNFIDFVSKPIRKAELALKMKQKEKELIDLNSKLDKEKKILTKYFSDEFVESVLNEEIPLDLNGDILDVTILFFDLRNSTGISEILSPEEFADFLSAMFTDIMDLVTGSKGSVNKLLGDGLMATWGCPFPNQNDAYNAVLCATKILEHFKKMNHVKPEKIIEDIRCGIGIATGRVFAGNIGSVKRMEYTVLGEAVNIASRLEAVTKLVGKPIIIDGNTKNLLEGKIKFTKEEIDTVRGKKGKVEIYSLDEILRIESV